MTHSLDEMNNNDGFWFPSMKVTEITSALEEWGLRMSEDQIQRPTAETVQQVYVCFLQQITGLTPELLQDPVGRALVVVAEYPELYSNSLNLNLVLHHLYVTSSWHYSNFF